MKRFILSFALIVSSGALIVSSGLAEAASTPFTLARDLEDLQGLATSVVHAQGRITIGDDQRGQLCYLAGALSESAPALAEIYSLLYAHSPQALPYSSVVTQELKILSAESRGLLGFCYSDEELRRNPRLPARAGLNQGDSSALARWAKVRLVPRAIRVNAIHLGEVTPRAQAFYGVKTDLSTLLGWIDRTSEYWNLVRLFEMRSNPGDNQRGQICGALGAMKGMTQRIAHHSRVLNENIPAEETQERRMARLEYLKFMAYAVDSVDRASQYCFSDADWAAYSLPLWNQTRIVGKGDWGQLRAALTTEDTDLTGSLDAARYNLEMLLK